MNIPVSLHFQHIPAGVRDNIPDGYHWIRNTMEAYPADVAVCSASPVNIPVSLHFQHLPAGVGAAAVPGVKPVIAAPGTGQRADQHGLAGQHA